METFELISNIINPPLPNSPHFPLRQYSIKPRNTTATIAVVKNVLHRRALRHLKTKKEKNLNKGSIAAKVNAIRFILIYVYLAADCLFENTYADLNITVIIVESNNSNNK